MVEYNPLIDQARVIFTNYIKRVNSSIFSILVYSSFGEREAWWENTERVISLFSSDKSKRWRVGWVWCFYSNHTSGIFFLSKKFIFLYGLLLFFLPFFLVSFLKILTTEFSNEEDVAVVVFCFWCIVLGAWILNKGLSPYGCIYIERVLYQHRKIWLQMMRPKNVFFFLKFFLLLLWISRSF